MESSLSTVEGRNNDNSEAPQAGGKSNYKWKVLVSVIFGTFMVILDSTAVNVAIPTLQREFKAPIDQVDGVLTTYVLALGIVTPLRAGSQNDLASSASILLRWASSYWVQPCVR